MATLLVVAVPAALAGALLAFLAVAFWGSIAAAGAAVWQWLTTTGLGLLKLGFSKALAWFGGWWWAGFKALGVGKLLRSSLYTGFIDTVAFTYNTWQNEGRLPSYAELATVGILGLLRGFLVHPLFAGMARVSAPGVTSRLIRSRLRRTRVTQQMVVLGLGAVAGSASYVSMALLFGLPISVTGIAVSAVLGMVAVTLSFMASDFGLTGVGAEALVAGATEMVRVGWQKLGSLWQGRTKSDATEGEQDEQVKDGRKDNEET